MSDSTINPFALALLYYDQYKSSMLLNSIFFDKVAQKYAMKPSKLLVDLEAKYGYPVGRSITLEYLSKLMVSYNVSEKYRSLCYDKDITSDLPVYCEIYDVVSDKFDAAAVLQDHRLISTENDLVSYDNISRLKHLIPGNESKTSITVAAPAKPKQSSSSSTDKDKDKDPSCLYRIMLDTVYGDGAREGEGPTGMLLRCVHDKARIQVLIRRRKGVHGILRGYIKAFDKHWNLILVDVDEEYVPLNSKKKFRKSLISSELLSQKQINDGGVLKRHLPQLLVRGDTIILINRSFPSP